MVENRIFPLERKRERERERERDKKGKLRKKGAWTICRGLDNKEGGECFFGEEGLIPRCTL